MATLLRSKQKTSPKPKSGPAAGRAKILATPTRTAKVLKEKEAGSSMTLSSLLQQHSLDGLSWKMSSGSSAPKGAKHLRQLPTSSKRSGIWGAGSRATLSMRVCPTIEKEYSLSQVIDPNPPISSFLTAANATGILRREERNGRTLDPIFEAGLQETIRFWFNVGEVLGIPRQKVLAPRFALKPEDIKAAIVTDRFSVARNLTWDECEQLMGFPEGWTAVEGDSLATPLPRRSRSGSGAKSSESKQLRRKGK
jgi:hypothetical protein